MIICGVGMFFSSQLFGNEPAADYGVHTIFGVQNGGAWPYVYNTGLSGNYVRGYVAGVFKLGTDLTHPELISDTDIMCGVVYTGTETSGSGRIVVNGIVRQTLTTLGCTEVRMTWATTATVVPTTSLQGLSGWCDYIELVTNTGYIIEWTNEVTPLVFDSYNVKTAWYVDQVTGAGEGIFTPNNPIYASSSSAYVAHPFTGREIPFDWSKLPADGKWDTYYAQDRSAEIGLYVNLGGYAPSWTSNTPAPPWTGIFYNLGYASPRNPSERLVDGGAYFPNGGVRIPGTALAATDYVSYYATPPGVYYQPDDAYDAPVANAGLRYYPGIEASSAWNGEFTEALNFGRPVLFEKWYSRTPPVRTVTVFDIRDVGGLYTYGIEYNPVLDEVWLMDDGALGNGFFRFGRTDNAYKGYVARPAGIGTYWEPDLGEPRYDHVRQVIYVGDYPNFGLVQLDAASATFVKLLPWPGREFYNVHPITGNLWATVLIYPATRRLQEMNPDTGTIVTDVPTGANSDGLITFDGEGNVWLSGARATGFIRYAPSTGITIYDTGLFQYQSVYDSSRNSLWSVVSIGSNGATASIVAITQANPCVVTHDTPYNPPFTTGDYVIFTGMVGMRELVGSIARITVIDSTHFSIDLDSTSFGIFVSGVVHGPGLILQEYSLNTFTVTQTIRVRTTGFGFTNDLHYDATMQRIIALDDSSPTAYLINPVSGLVEQVATDAAQYPYYTIATLPGGEMWIASSSYRYSRIQWGTTPPAVIDVAGDASTSVVLTIGTPITSTIDFAGDRDWYRVTLTQGVIYTFTQRAPPGGFGGLDSYLRLRDSDSLLLAEDDDSGAQSGGNRDSLITWTATYTGVHYVEAGAYNDSGVGSYTILAVV